MAGTTGLGTAGSDFGGLGDALKNNYDKPFENNMEGETEVWSALEKAEGFEITKEAGDGSRSVYAHGDSRAVSRDILGRPQNLKRRRYFGRYRSDKWQREPR